LLSVEVPLGAVVISLLGERADFLALATDCLNMALNLVLLSTESLFELYLVTFAVSEASTGVAVGFALFGLAGRSGLQVQHARY
jgi:hypothetical protein